MGQRRQIWILLWMMVASLAALSFAQHALAETTRPTQVPIGDREMVVTNHTNKPVVELYISSQDADSWGQDRLEDDELPPGQNVHLKLGRTRACNFDVLAVYEDASREESRGVNICRDRELAFDGKHATPPPEPLGPERSVTVINESPRPIQQLYFSPPDAAQWGEDLLVASTISAHDQRRIAFHGACSVDVRVVFSNRAAEERRGLDLCRFPELRIEPGWTTIDRPDARD